MQKSSSVSLSSLKSIFVLASKSLGLFTSFRHASCCALSPDVKRMLSLVVHSILMWKECCLMLCTQSWCEKNVIIWPKKLSGFCTSCVVCITASCCALSPHVEKKMLSTPQKIISTWRNHMGAHPSEVYFWITLSCIIWVGGREGGGLDLFLWA